MNDLREQILLLIQTPLFAIVIALELLIAHIHLKKYYTVKETVHSIYLSVLNFFVDLGFRTVYLGVFLFCFKHSFFHLDKSIWYWVALVIVEDFVFYWLHRNDHFIRFFWATHVTHHSAQHYNISVGFRSSVFEPLYRFVYFIPIVFLGFEPIDVMFIFSATQLWGTLVHTKLIGKLGVFEKIFVTPSHHRVHHASNPKYLDKNMGMFLIIWDKMFGTFQEELPEDKYEPIRYGLTHNLTNPNAVTVVLHEFIQMFKDITAPGLTRKERIMYLFGKPGYSHDGSRMTSDMMRAKEESKEPAAPAKEKEETIENPPLQLDNIL